MPDAVPRMKRKRPRDPKLHDALAHGAEAAEPLGHGRGLEVPAQQRRNQVRGAENVEAAREDAAGDAVEAGRVPGYLGLVDGEVRGDGAVAALGDEDGVLVRGLRRLCLRGGFRGGGLEGDMSKLFTKHVSCIGSGGSGEPTGGEEGRAQKRGLAIWLREEMSVKDVPGLRP